jgi:predicted CoA-binding protein
MPNDPALIDEMLRDAKTIAVVGMSDKPWRASHNIGKYLAEQGYRVFPVNPALKEILGRPCYPTLDAADVAALKEEGSVQTGRGTNDPGLNGPGIDLVDVFRASENVPPIVDDVIRLKIPYLWLQDGVIHDEAIARARAAGVKCIQNDCIYREHAGREHAKRSSESAS